MAAKSLKRPTQEGSTAKRGVGVPRLLAAPGLLDREHDIVREGDDTDAEHDARQELFALLVAAAKKP